MSALDKIKQGKRLTAAFLYELLYGIANGDVIRTYVRVTGGFGGFASAGTHTIKLRSAANTGGTVAIDGHFRVRIR